MHTEYLCSYCNGSGEGMYDGTRCHSCRGSGVDVVEVEVEYEKEDAWDSG